MTTDLEDGDGPRWSTWREALAVVVQPQLLRRTLSIAVVVGTVLSLVNQGHLLARGDADGATWGRVAANYAIPFLVSNVGALSATRR